MAVSPAVWAAPAPPLAAFAGYYLIAAVGCLTQRDGLYDAYLAYARSQFLQRFLVKFASWLVGVRLDMVNGYLVQIRRPLCLHLAGVNQSVESAPVAQVVKSASQYAFVVFLVYCHFFFVEE